MNNTFIHKKNDLFKKTLLAMMVLFSTVGCDCGKGKEEPEPENQETPATPQEEEKRIWFTLTAPAKEEAKTAAWLDNSQSTEGMAKPLEKKNLTFTLTLVSSEPIDTRNYKIRVENEVSYKYNNFTMPKDDISPNKVHLASPTHDTLLSDLCIRYDAPDYLEGPKLGTVLAPGAEKRICYKFQASTNISNQMARSAQATLTIVDLEGNPVSEPQVVYWSGAGLEHGYVSALASALASAVLPK